MAKRRSRLRAFFGWTFGIVFTLIGIVVLTLLGFRYAAYDREAKAPQDAAPKSGTYVKAVDVEIFVQEMGKPDAPAVLFVHGTGAWSEAWRASLEAASNAGFRAIAMDLPPFGYSTRPPDASYSKDAQGARILAVLDGLGIERAILVGHSFGGGPTTEAAMKAPGRVRALILVDGALSIEPDTGGLAIGAERTFPPAVKAVLGMEAVRDSLVASFLTNPMFTRKLLEAFIDNPERATDAWVEIYRRPHEVRGTTPALGDWLPELVGPARVSRSEVASNYTGMTIPLFAIWGDRDTITPLAQGERLVGLVKGAKLVRLNGVGHIPQIEDTARFNRTLVEVLEQARAAP